ncbi:flagellar biosynthesis anti-sigma factor FlgM [Shewanella morhuae]|uniref:Negative regulator of flagellin synthesis n=1 Tax=Shewanella morhuae TaxID=365591 RepID=A0A380B3J3_9GAMM|nr:flagellar biosynthesis anti-sigma factor FlgM [Shewanella morhuae]PTA51609.1 flagellar biosynthesis anti-sigma factor FlgM [Shewanella morhuae]SUI91578.1 anti-sigma28 factor FlgM [Shewanella morhuae]
MEINKISSAVNTEFNTNKGVTTHKKNSEVETQSLAKQQDISNDWKLLAQAQQTLQSVSDVDMDKVANIRNALSNGSFEIMLDKIADKILAQHGK